MSGKPNGDLLMRRPRLATPKTPQSTAGDSAQKNGSAPPTSSKYSPKVRDGSHESKGYKVGRKHNTEAYGG